MKKISDKNVGPVIFNSAGHTIGLCRKAHDGINNDITDHDHELYFLVLGELHEEYVNSLTQFNDCNDDLILKLE